MDKFKTMTYKEFKAYCNERACDGKWSMDEALKCIAIIEEINAIKVKSFGLLSKKRTEQAKEKAGKMKISQEEK